MKKLFLLFLSFACCSMANAQKSDVDSLAKAYKKNKQDTTLVQLIDEKAIKTELQNNTDSGLLHTRQALALSRRIHYEQGEAQSLVAMASFLAEKGDLPGSLKVTFEVLPMATKLKDYDLISECYNTLGLTYGTLKNSPKALECFHKSLAVAEQANLDLDIVIRSNNLSREFLDMDQLDSALWYTNKAYNLC